MGFWKKWFGGSERGRRRHRTIIRRTVYLREATVTELEQTLQELGALRVSKNLYAWRSRFPASGDVVVEIQVLEDVPNWEMELEIESFRKWRAPFAGLGWEPTLAAFLQCDGRPHALKATNTLVQGILTSHPGVADDNA